MMIITLKEKWRQNFLLLLKSNWLCTPAFQAQPPPELKPSGPHSWKGESHLRKIPVPFLPFLSFETQSRSVTIVPACSAKSAIFRREREMSGVTNSVLLSRRSSAFSLFGSSTQFHLLEQGSIHTQFLKKVLGTGPFLFIQAEIELLLSKFEPGDFLEPRALQDIQLEA